MPLKSAPGAEPSISATAAPGSRSPGERGLAEATKGAEAAGLDQIYVVGCAGAIPVGVPFAAGRRGAALRDGHPAADRYGRRRLHPPPDDGAILQLAEFTGIQLYMNADIPWYAPVQRSA